MCNSCGAQFVRQYGVKKWKEHLHDEYLFGKQTLKQLAEKYGKTEKTIQKYFDQYQTTRDILDGIPVVIGIDCTFFGRVYGIIVVRCPILKQNIYWKEITAENKAVYQEARKYLEDAGFNIRAVVLDAKHGNKEVFSDVIVQICQYHEQQIIQRYLTTRPKTEAGQELRTVASLLTKTTERSFSASLRAWNERWEGFLKERTYAPDGKHWWYTHRRLRSAYRSLKTNLPYLFNYQRYPELNIPNTNNSIEGYFSKIKQLLNNHHGLKRWRRYKLIEEVLNN